ncbi:MAG: PrsW family intramembrane metalloprotease [Symploca sp. SIO2G7]|nr:PrsW family intramembrane metalloprotease [Symploca sp. SIO2G7]
MTGQLYKGYLRQLSTGSAPDLPLLEYKISDNQEIVIGRDSNCQIVLDQRQYTIVSRRHLAIRSIFSQKNGLQWKICDLDSANGTYLNGQLLQGCQKLVSGDRIELGQNGPQFIFEDQSNYSLSSSSSSSPRSNAPAAISQPTKRPTVSGKPKDLVTLTQLFPIFSTGRDLTQKAFLIPGILTVFFVVLMFAAVGEPIVFNLLIAAYLAGAALFFVYQLCGKPKPWWVLLSCTTTTSLILISPLLSVFITIFREILPGNLPNQGEQISFGSLLVQMFFGAGLMEELLKALPVLGAFFFGKLLRSPWRQRVGIWEPLDGILLGAASAVGFTLVETLGQYVPEIINNVTLQASEGQGQLLGLQLLIPRVLGSVAGHMAYSGYLGYFIGLSVLKPRQGWLILLIGYISASALHALWNTTGYISGLLLAIVGVLSYAFLAAAILKARALSPTRSQNFATRFFGD